VIGNITATATTILRSLDWPLEKTISDSRKQGLARAAD
jgi:hypothetical protein